MGETISNRNGTAPGSLLLRGADIILKDQILSQGSLLIEDGRIASLYSSDHSQPVSADQTLELANLSLFPGFIDVHIHGAAGVDTMEADADGLRKVSEFLLKQGATGWLPTLVPAPQADYHHALGAIKDAMESPGGARTLGVHYEGPFVNSDQCGALRREFFRSFSSTSQLEELPRLPGTTETSPKHMMTIAPEIDGGIELVRELRRRGWVVSIGHTRAEFELLDKAFAAGARHMTHFMNAMKPLHHRSPGPVAWGLARDDVSCDVIADGIHLDPYVLRLLVKLKGAERLMLISDAIAVAGLGDGEYQIWDETITVRDGRTANARNSIAGSVITMLDAVRMMRSLGVSDVEVAKMASTNPARLLGLDELGSIEIGKHADLVALDEAGNVKLTVIGGCVYS
jgi:N-acetylglucosamine-6-phosphate deacetylase